jgi:hypothetical protein
MAFKVVLDASVLWTPPASMKVAALRSSTTAVVTLSQLPVGPSVGAAAAVLILGSNGVAAAAAAGVLLTVTGTVGGLCFLGWASADRIWSVRRRRVDRGTSSDRPL